MRTITRLMADGGNGALDDYQVGQTFNGFLGQVVEIRMMADEGAVLALIIGETGALRYLPESRVIFWECEGEK